ncbi:DUF5709 domain-containing protein [Streptomyces sp. NRRL S-340]|uniref:DUF5709 domain-containing protein n=1 Tax=Streptomyces sp. NRRL S-340 TaxID=1463901 RepID=UPI00055A6F39|nr:DUF5709 domain-containing protein [Streptomyces sp. NRRL S-340]
MSDEMMGDEVYQPYGTEVQDDAGLLDASDTLIYEAGPEALDEGYSPPERPLGVEHTGVTASERLRGETLDERLAEEVPDVMVPPGDGIGDIYGTDGELVDTEVGDERAGRLVAPSAAFGEPETDVYGIDAGLDGAGASAEEAAMHVIPDAGSF